MKKIYGVLLLVGVLAGCSKKRNLLKKNLKPIADAQAEYVETKNDIVLKVKRLTPKKTKEYFGELNDVQPIQFSLLNNGNKKWFVNLQNLGISLVDLQKIQDMLTESQWYATKNAWWLLFPIVIGAAVFIILLPFPGFACVMGSLAGAVALIVVTPIAVYSACADVKDREELNDYLKQEIEEKTGTQNMPLFTNLDAVVFTTKQQAGLPMKVTLQSYDKQELLEFNVVL